VQKAPKAAVVDPNQFVAPTEIPKEIPAPVDDAPVIGVSNIVGGIPGGVAGGVTGGVPGGVVGNLLSGVSAVAPPPPPKPVRRDPIKVGGNVQESKLIRRVEPVYPELAKRARVQGTVVLVVTVDEEGNVSDIKVSSGHPLLNDAAKSAVAQWKYSPTLLNGEPVPVIATVTVIFNLK
jgi:protein TonB